MMSYLKKQPFEALFALVVAGLLGLAGVQLAGRLAFGWDLYIWSESPFMTNMLKLDSGVPVYTAPEEANSFVYSPGLEYLTYGVLRPFGRQLDIRWCRAVSVALAVLASLALARCSVLLARAASPGREPGRLFGAVSAGCFFLVIYHNFTSDVPHPDNLYILHFSAVLMLTLEAVRRPSWRRAGCAILLASLGVYVKQMAALSALGVAATLALSAPRGERLRSGAWMLPLGLGASAAALGGLWAMGWMKFYTYDVLAGHAALGLKFKLWELFDSLFRSYRILPLGLYAVALASGLRSRNHLLAKYLLAHTLIGGIEVAPSVLAYLKMMGVWNNLTIIEAWSSVLFVPLLLGLMRPAPIGENQLESEAGVPLDFARMATLALALAFALNYVPHKLVPEAAHHDYCKAVQDSVSRDIHAGKRVLVAHGAMFQINGGSRQVPLDRANSVLELMTAGKADMAGTRRRIVEKYYDTIYLNSYWYSPDIYAAISENYRPVNVIPGTYDKVLPRYEVGMMGLTMDAPVFERK